MWRDAVGWTVFALVGLGLTALAVRGGAQLGTASAPFLGRYRVQLGPGTVLAPAVAVTVLLVAARGWLERVRWPVVVPLWGYLAALAWALSLALVDGAAGLTPAHRAASAKVKPAGPFCAINSRAARIKASFRLPW